jgi:hypothetical protein
MSSSPLNEQENNVAFRNLTKKQGCSYKASREIFKWYGSSKDDHSLERQKKHLEKILR